MKNTKKKGSHLAALVLACWGTAAVAENTLLTTPWQVGVSLGGVLPEDLRGVSAGPLAQLTLGIPLRPGAYLDARVFGFRAAGQQGKGSERTLAGGLDLRLERLAEQLGYHFLFGAGYAHSERGNTKIDAPYVNIGWGISYELTRKLALRTELRGLARFDKQFIAGRGLSYDAIGSAGLVYSLGQEPRSSYPVRATADNDAAAAPVASLPDTAIPTAAPELPPLVLPPRVVQRVYTAEDSCPPAPLDAVLDAQGCLAPQRLQLPRATFFDGLDATEISATGDATLAAVAATLVKNPGLMAQISVHTDTRGYADDNLQKTVALAALLTRRLFELGVGNERFVVSGRGEQQPRASEDSDVDIEKNRRVEIQLIAR